MSTEIIMPEMGEGVVEGTISRWLKKEGDPVQHYEAILEIETDKVTTEAMAEADGVLLKILVKEGETVNVGTVLGIIGQPDEQVSGSQVSHDQRKVEAKPAAMEERTVVSKAHADQQSRHQPPISRQTAVGRISPVVARMAVEHHLDLTQIKGTGRGGRITKKDVLTYLENLPAQAPVAAKSAQAPMATKSTLAAAPAQAPMATKNTLAAAPAQAPMATKSPLAAAPAQAKPVVASASTAQRASLPLSDKVIPLSKMRRAIAEHMVMSKHTSPHVTTMFEVDFSAVISHRQAHKAKFAQKGVRLTFTPYIISAIAQALEQYPMVNSSWSDQGIILHPQINIGMATALEEGLIVPVIKGADEFNLLGLARTVNDLAERARTNKLNAHEVKGGTFTLSNHGVSGSLFATPIINQPQCGILGVGAIQERVMVVNRMIAIRPMAYLSFSFDHRILDGASADHFVARVKQIIETWQ